MDLDLRDCFGRKKLRLITQEIRYVHEVLVNRLGGLSLPRKSLVRLTDRPNMTLDVYRGHKKTIQHAAGYEDNGQIT